MPLMKMLFPFLFLIIITGCDTTQKVPLTTEPIVKQLNILLKDGVQTEKLEANFSKYKLTKLKRLSFTENRWIFTFDANLISSDDILKELNNRPTVLDAKAVN